MYHVPSVHRPTLQRHGSRIDIRTTDGVISILYGAHVKEDRTTLPPSTNGLAIETGEGRWHRRPEETIEYHRTSTINRQIRRLLEQAEQRTIPVYLLDPVWKTSRRRFLGDAAIAFIEGIAGAEMLQSLLPSETPSHKTSHNHTHHQTDTITTMIRGALAAWLLSPIVTSAGRAVSTITGVGHAITAPLHKVSHRLHPEQFLLTATLRNLVIAEKLHYLLPQIDQPPHIVTTIGGAHTGIEDHLQLYTSEDRLRSLARWKFFLQNVIPDTFHHIIRCDFRNKKWQKTSLFNIETLKKLTVEPPSKVSESSVAPPDELRLSFPTEDQSSASR